MRISTSIDVHPYTSINSKIRSKLLLAHVRRREPFIDVKLTEKPNSMSARSAVINANETIINNEEKLFITMRIFRTFPLAFDRNFIRQLIRMLQLYRKSFNKLLLARKCSSHPWTAEQEHSGYFATLHCWGHEKRYETWCLQASDLYAYQQFYRELCVELWRPERNMRRRIKNFHANGSFSDLSIFNKKFLIEHRTLCSQQKTFTWKSNKGQTTLND